MKPGDDLDPIEALASTPSELVQAFDRVKTLHLWVGARLVMDWCTDVVAYLRLLGHDHRTCLEYTAAGTCTGCALVAAHEDMTDTVDRGPLVADPTSRKLEGW